jgi:hypothetical protein
MRLGTKAQEEMIARVKERYTDWKEYWDAKIFKPLFSDYRRMANGYLPDKMAKALAHTDYDYNSKLIPRVIPDAIQYMKAIASNSLFNRDMVFEFHGVRKEDSQRAPDANDLVNWIFEHTEFMDTAEQLIEDALEVGICYMERRHWRDMRPVVKYGRNKFGRKILLRNSLETIFDGPCWYRLRPEMVYLDPDKRHPKQKPEYAKTMQSTIGHARAEATGLYREYADNIPKIEPGHYDPTAIYENDQVSDHRGTDSEPRKADENFPFLYTEQWFEIQHKNMNVPIITCIGIANYNTTPQLLRFDIDPMQTGESGLEIGRIYPRNDRMIGECVPEKIKSYMLAKFYARNQRIDLVNLARDVTGILFASGEIGDIDSLVTRRKRIIKMHSSLPAEMKDIKLDTTPIPHLQAEEAFIDSDIEKTLATNRITMGQTPSRRETATAIAVVNENSQIMSNYPLRQIEKSIIKPGAMGYLIHSQLLMPEKFKARILGKYRAPEWKDMKRSDILGVFDVKCYGSSEILAKGVKQALMDKFVQTWSANPHVRADWQGLMRENLKMSEVPAADRYVPETSFDLAYAERENGMMINGVVIKAIEEDNHPIHQQEHLKIRDVAEEATLRTKQAGLGNEFERAVTILSNIEEHIKQHAKFEQLIQGQTNIGPGSELPVTENTQTLQRDLNSDMNPEVLGG